MITSNTTVIPASAPPGAQSTLSQLDEGGLLGQRYTLVSAENATLVVLDSNGCRHTCTDFISAYAAVNFGHRNPDIDSALASGSDLSALFCPQEAALVADWLCAAVGGGDRRVLYQVGGSFAVSTAVALARRHRPGRALAVRGAFHGLGVDSSALTSVQREFALQDTGLPSRLSQDTGWLSPGDIPSDWRGISCVIYEPVQGANGYVPLDRKWLRDLCDSARAADVTTIADEIQCGFYRHGALSVSRDADLNADIVLFGKSLTNGMYPLSAVVYKNHLEPAGGPAVRLAHTFQTGALGFAAAWQVAQYLDHAPVTAMCRQISAKLAAAVADWHTSGAVRNVHVTGPTLSFEPVHVPADALVREAFRRGVLAFTGGTHGERVRIAPPLTIPLSQLNAALENFGGAVADVSKT